jgi:hypothetical protein
MTLSGEIDLIPGLKLETDIFVTNSGLISAVETQYCVTSVSQIIDGAVDQVIHLIGYPNNHIQHLTTDGVIRSTNELNTQLKRLPSRAPGSYLLQENDKLCVVIIDWNSEAKVVGLINEVIPRQQTNGKCNTVVIHKDGNWKTTNSRDHELSALISLELLQTMVFYSYKRKTRLSNSCLN